MKKKHMKLLGLALTVSMTMASLAGCGSDAGTSEPVQASTPEPEKKAEAPAESGGGEETIRVITFFAGSDQWAPTYQEVIKEYQETHPGIKISDESVPTAGTNDVFRPKMNADIAAGTPTDCALYFNGSDAEPLYESGLYVTWDDILKDDPEWAAQFRESAMEYGKTNGEQSNLPYIGSFEALVYNQKIFDDYNLEYPTSWDNIYKACEVLGQTDIIPITNTLLNPTCQLETMLLANVGPEDQKKTLDDSWAATADQFKKLYDLNAFPADCATITDADTRVIMADGRAAMTFTGSWSLNALKDNPDMRMIAVPAGENGQEGAIISAFSSGWFMSKAAYERSSATLDFIKYMCSPEILSRFIAVGGLPAMDIEMPENDAPLINSANEMTANATAMNPPIDTQMPREVFNNFSKKLIYVCENQMTAEQLLEESRQMLESIKADQAK